MPGNRRKSLITTFSRIRDGFLSKAGKIGGFAKLINNLPSLLTPRNLGRVVKYMRLFGFTATYEEVSKKLRSGRYFLDEVINKTPVINNIKILEEETIPNEDLTISVVIPVKNAGDDFQRLLSMIRNQKGFKDIEIIIVDSGSTDGSLEIAEEFGAKIVKILPEEFSHSFARNLGADHASGEYLLFTVQDALPPSDLWLYELFIVIKYNDVVAVSCAEYPREDADLFYRAITWDHYNNFLELGIQDRIMCKPDEENYFTLRKNAQMSNVACLISRDVFMKYKFKGNYAEDLELGVRLIKDGHKHSFISSTRIIHSHNRPPYYHLKRGYVDNLLQSQIFPDHPIVDVEAKRLFRDIIFIYDVVNSIVYNDLQKVTVPCTIRNLSSVVMEKFRAAARGSYPFNIDKSSNVYIDSKFRSFLENVYNHQYFGDGNYSPYDGILLGAMQSTTMLIFEYMYDTYDLVDKDVLEDFKSSLYKAYALICGAHLASCFFQNSGNAKEKLRKIDDELTREV